MLESPTYAFGPFRLSPARRLVLRDGTPVPLTPRAFDILVMLVERRDRVVTKEELLEHVWQGAAVEEGSLTQQIFLLRKALEERGIDGHCIATIPRRGYRFVREVELAPLPPEAVWLPPVTGRRGSWRPWAVGAGLVVIVVAVYLVSTLARAPAPDHTMVLTPMTREPGVESFPSFSPDGREFVYAVGPLDYFGEVDIYRRGVGLDRPFNLTPDSPGADTQPAYSPDGSLIAFRSDRDGGGVFVMRPDGSGVRALTREGFNPSWSPDGTEVLYATIQTTASPYSNGAQQSATWAVSVQTGVRRRIRPGAAAAPQWSPHGHRIAYWAAGSISTCAPDGSAPVTAVEADAGVYAWNPVWSRDGKYLYFSSNRNGPMHLWRIQVDERTGSPLAPAEPAPVPMASTFAAHVSFDATGRRLLFTSAPVTVAIQRVRFDVATGELRGNLAALTSGSRGWVWPEPSPDGSRLTFHPALPDPEEIYVSAADGTQIHALTEGMRARLGRWSPDGRRIAFYSGRDGQGNIWIVGADGRDLRQVSRSSAVPVIFPVWAPDGRMAASEFGQGGRSFIFNPDGHWGDPDSLTVLRDPEPGVQFVPWSWSADGTRLAGFSRRPKGIIVLSLATGTYTRFTRAGSTPVWLPDGRRFLYAVDDRLVLFDTETGRARDVLNVAPARLEFAAGGGFSLSSAGYIYLAPVTRDGDIWLASAR